MIILALCLGWAPLGFAASIEPPNSVGGSIGGTLAPATAARPVRARPHKVRASRHRPSRRAGRYRRRGSTKHCFSVHNQTTCGFTPGR